MPGGDRTGPAGMGPMSGRGAGFCGGFGRATGKTFREGPGATYNRWGAGPGRGWRWRHRVYWTAPGGWMPPGGASGEIRQPDPESEKMFLQSKAEALRAELDSISKRLEQFESPARED